MDVEAVVSVVIHKVTDLLIQEAIIFDKVINQVEHIRVEVRHMRGLLRDAEKDEAAKGWVKRYLETSYKVEDIIESYVLKLAHKKREMGLFKSYGLFFHDRPACWSLRKKMKSIEEEIKELYKYKPAHVEDASLKSFAQEDLDQIDFDDYQESYSGYTGYNFRQTNRVPSSNTEQVFSEFIWFKEHAEKLTDLLSRNGGERIISVGGKRGSGKTTLVRQVYNHKSTRQSVCRAWINVSEEHAVKDLSLGIWNQVNNKKKDREIAALDDDQLKAKLVEFFQEHQCLIVLDDAREQPGAWRELMDAFRDIGNGKVLLISHQEVITDDLKGERLYLQPLEAEEGWELFIRLLCPQGGSSQGLPLNIKRLSYPQQTALRNRILQKCQGVPRNIKLLAGLLSTKGVRYGEWTRLLNQANWHSSEIWLLSYNDLPENYKLCLLYMALFPKEFDISARRIRRLWVAEGFIRRSKGGAEDSAEECFNYLVTRNFIKISKFRSDGGPKKCCLPGFLGEEFLKRAQEISLFHVNNKKTPIEESELPPFGVRRIVEYADIKDYAPNSTSNSLLIKNLRSYLSFNFPRYDAPAQQVGNFLRKIIGNKGYGMLRVLDLEGVYKPILPSTLKHLLQLRYLGLRWTFLDILPKSVGDLPYLETLDLKRTNVNDLPSSVWKLQHLRYLNLPQVQLNMDMQQPSSQLITLWGLIINDGRNMDGLALLHDLRELGITCQLKKFETLNSWITRLNRLRSLSITSKDDKGRPSILCLDPLSHLGELSHLKLLGKLPQLYTKDQFPRYLKVLTLSVSNLSKDPMPTLSQLPYLVVLRLLAKSYLGQEMHCPENGFMALCTLKLWMLEELKEWIVQEGGMPRIRELNIRHCHKLKEIPSELLKRDTLEELILDDMPNLEKETRNHKLPHTILKTHPYTFSPLPWEKDDKDPQLWPQEDNQASSLQVLDEEESPSATDIAVTTSSC